MVISDINAIFPFLMQYETAQLTWTVEVWMFFQTCRVLQNDTMLFAIALNSLHNDNIGSTPDNALQARLHSEPCLFNATNFFEFEDGYLGEWCGEKG